MDEEFKRLSGHELMDQAAGTAQFYMSRAVEDIDKRFGKGYAAKHPGLVGAYMQAAAMDYSGTILAQKLLCVVDGLENIGFFDRGPRRPYPRPVG